MHPFAPHGDQAPVLGAARIASSSIEHPEPSEETARALVTRLVNGGAIMTLPTHPSTQQLVGHLTWQDDAGVFWFPAFGDTLEDARLFQCDEVQMVEDIGVYFLSHGKVLGYLSAIDAAGLDDPDDFHIAWSIWERMAPVKMPFIEQCRMRLELSHDGLEVGAALRAALSLMRESP